MDEIKMSPEALIRALRRMASETGSLNCLGCGHEHSCSTHGCTVLKAAAETIRADGTGGLDPRGRADAGG